MTRIFSFCSIKHGFRLTSTTSRSSRSTVFVGPTLVPFATFPPPTVVNSSSPTISPGNSAISLYFVFSSFSVVPSTFSPILLIIGSGYISSSSRSKTIPKTSESSGTRTPSTSVSAPSSATLKTGSVAKRFLPDTRTDRYVSSFSTRGAGVVVVEVELVEVLVEVLVVEVELVEVLVVEVLVVEVEVVEVVEVEVTVELVVLDVDVDEVLVEVDDDVDVVVVVVVGCATKLERQKVR